MTPALSAARRVLRTPSGAAGALMLAALTAVVLTAIFAAPDPAAQDLGARLAGPGQSHLLGSDHLGRDLLARLGAAVRGSVWVAVVAALLSGVGGGLLGLASGYAGGWSDLTVQRLVDALMAFPVVVLALAVIAATGPTRTGVIIALSLAFTPLAARVARASALSLRHSGYSEAARAMGAGPVAVLFRHIVPNAAGPWLAVTSTQVGAALAAEASLSFLGVGVQGTGSLGAMLGREAQVYMHSSAWIIIWPGLALALATMAANLLADAASEGLRGAGTAKAARSVPESQQPAAVTGSD